ncbi:MFS transporter [Phenylobacterium deserti]|uniref:MFS transporter n=1 Tax=Phenylobacterium deserti TaxID=1914756 RepID=A0A328ANT7_9CAUL|nr:MFS transporter [Phenylobacterium deserti]RAK56682.1 MFS transporter [Phenylobacterium deserti]
MAGFLAPQAQIGGRELDRGVRNLMLDAIFATAVGALNSGVVIVAFALWLGAPNTVIGLLAAIPLWTQILQAPAVSLVERLRARRRISVAALLTARLALPCMAMLPFVPDKRLALALLLLLEVIHTGANAICACSWNSWIRDLVPEERLGRFFARRTIWATAVGMICTLTAGFALQSQHAARGGGSGMVFTVLYMSGFAAAMISTWRLALVPEPIMPKAQPKQSLFRLLKAPLKDKNFRNIIRFLASWQFAVNAATPFFTVYFVQQLGLGMGYVTAFTVVSQLANLLVLREWGRLTDRFSNKAVLNAAAPVFLLCIAGMTVASQIDQHLLLVAYLALLHVVMGMAAAGVGLATGNVVLKCAPRSTATAYIAANSLIASAAAGLAPILAGASADFYAARELTIQILWRDPGGVREFFGFQITQWGFFFLIAAGMGLYALHRLTFITEEGTIRGRAVVQEIIGDTRRGVRNLSPVRGLRPAFPAGSLLELHGRYREQKRADRARASRAARQAKADEPPADP